MEEKLRKAIVTNTQLENEKQNFLFQVDSLKDDYEEVEENFYRLQRDFKEKTKVIKNIYTSIYIFKTFFFSRFRLMNC